MSYKSLRQIVEEYKINQKMLRETSGSQMDRIDMAEIALGVGDKVIRGLNRAKLIDMIRQGFIRQTIGTIESAILDFTTNGEFDLAEQYLTKYRHFLFQLWYYANHLQN